MSDSEQSLRTALSEKGFLTVAIVLLVAALSLNATVQSMKLHFKKEPVALRMPLNKVPDELGHWHRVSEDVLMNEDFVHELGTKEYIFRDYVDDRLVSLQEIESFKGKTDKERRALLMAIQRGNPAAVMHLAVTYYTGMVDTVAHIPDRCYIAGGYEPSAYEVVQWDIGARTIGARLITFEDQATRSKNKQNVAYFFQANGSYYKDPLGVRGRLQNLLERHGYYAKVELLSLVQDERTVKRTMGEFLSQALPAIEKCLPDWQQVTGAGAQ